MDDPFTGMDPEKRRRGSLAVLRALYPQRFGGENPPDHTPPAPEDAAASAEPAASAGSAAPEEPVAPVEPVAPDQTGVPALPEGNGSPPATDSADCPRFGGHRCGRG